MSTFRRPHAAFAALLLSSLALPAAADVLSVPPDSPRWETDGQVKVTDFLGRRCLDLDGGVAAVKDFDMRDGVLDVDVETPAARGFFGLQFRIAGAGGNSELVYLRQHKSGYPDAMQYTPVLHTGFNWQIYNGPGFTGAVDIPRNEWFHLRLEVTAAQANLFVKDMDKPALLMDDLKSGVQSGRVGLFDLTGETCFANFEVRTTPDAPWQRHEPPMPPDTLVRWSISPVFDALARSPEKAPSSGELAAMSWQDVQAEPPGFVVLYRYLDAPHLMVAFQRDFSRRLEPQPGTKLVYARTRVKSDRDKTARLMLGYSDEVSVFLNGAILWRGRSAQAFRDPQFLGIVNPENDTVYLPLKKGDNDLLLAVSELGGGWGFIGRLSDLP
jgi:hypothetical protein